MVLYEIWLRSNIQRIIPLYFLSVPLFSQELLEETENNDPMCHSFRTRGNSVDSTSVRSQRIAYPIAN